MPNDKKPGVNGKPVKKAVSRVKRQKKKTAKTRRPLNLRMGNLGFGALVVGALVAVIFFIYVKVQGEISLPENAIGSLLSPVQSVVTNVTSWIRGKVAGLTSSGQLQEQVRSLELDVMRLEYQVSQLQEEADENDRLSALLNAYDRYEELDPIYARVIAKDPGRWFEIFTINRGQSDGITRGMAVISSGGLVGRVYEVGLYYAKVVCIINADSVVACLVERTRDNGIMRGQLSASAGGDLCRMYYVPSVNDIMPGDAVVTSGLDGVYPKGLTVGVVSEVSRQSEMSDQYLTIAPAADFEHIEEVLVLQTIVETANDMAPVPTATTRAVATTVPPPTPTPGPGEYQLATGEAPNGWAYPTTTPDPNATPVPAVLENYIEDIWAAPKTAD